MSTVERQRVESLFEAALELDAAARPDFVAAECGADVSTRTAVLALLAAHERAEGVLERDPRELLTTDAPPARLGPYRVLRELGRGGMGVVYDAERDDGQFHRRVAIKIIQGGRDAELQRRVLAERQILAALDHPGIARLLDGGVAEDGRPYLVMEFVDGMPVDVYCERMRLTVAERLRLFVTIARTVDFAHRNLVVHRDLKPSNVLVTADGSVKLLDFGVAKLLNPQLGANIAATRDRAALTPEYASPEQIQGLALTTTADVYSLGVMLYELLCGSRPFAHLEHDAPAFLRAVCDGDVERPSARVLRTETIRHADGSRTVTPDDVARARHTTPPRLARQLRGDCDAIVAMALRAEPQRRYGSAELLAQDVERHLAERPVRAHHGSRGYTLGKLIRRHRVQAAALLLAAVSLVGGAAAAARQAAAAHHERLGAEAARAQSEQVTEFLLELFTAGNPTTAPGPVTARDLVRRGAARIDDLADQPILQARMLGVLGRIHESLGDHEEAQRLTQRALTTRSRLGLAPDADAAELMLQLGILQRRRGAYDSAQASFARAREIAEAAAGGPHAVLPSILQQLASIAIYRGDNVEALRRAEEALTLTRQQFGEHDRATVNQLRHLGAVQWRRGLYDDAEATLRQAIALRPRAVGSTRHEGINDLMQFAELLRTVNRFDDAERIYEDVGRGLSRDVPEDIPFIIWSTGGRANMAEMRGDLQRALLFRREVLAIRQSVLGDDHPDVAGTKVNVAITLARLGRFDEAEQFIAQGRAVIAERYPDVSQANLSLIADIGRVRFVQQRYAEADSLMARALEIHHALRLPTSSIPYAERLTLRARIQLALGHPERAEELLEQALAAALSTVTDDSRPVTEIREEFAKLYRAWGKPDRSR